MWFEAEQIAILFKLMMKTYIESVFYLFPKTVKPDISIGNEFDVFIF